MLLYTRYKMQILGMHIKWVSDVNKDWSQKDNDKDFTYNMQE